MREEFEDGDFSFQLTTLLDDKVSARLARPTIREDVLSHPKGLPVSIIRNRAARPGRDMIYHKGVPNRRAVIYGNVYCIFCEKYIGRIISKKRYPMLLINIVSN